MPGSGADWIYCGEVKVLLFVVPLGQRLFGSRSAIQIDCQLRQQLSSHPADTSQDSFSRDAGKALMPVEPLLSGTPRMKEANP